MERYAYIQLEEKSLHLQRQGIFVIFLCPPPPPARGNHRLECAHQALHPLIPFQSVLEFFRGILQQLNHLIFTHGHLGIRPSSPSSGRDARFPSVEELFDDVCTSIDFGL